MFVERITFRCRGLVQQLIEKQLQYSKLNIKDSINLMYCNVHLCMNSFLSIKSLSAGDDMFVETKQWVVHGVIRFHLKGSYCHQSLVRIILF